jgi:hypothetical protein
LPEVCKYMVKSDLLKSLYRKLAIGIIALPVIVACFSLVERSSYFNWDSEQQILSFLAGLFFSCLFWLLFVIYKVASSEKQPYQFVVILLFGIAPILGAIFSRMMIHGYIIFLLLGYVIIAWPVCICWTIYLLSSKSDS